MWNNSVFLNTLFAYIIYRVLLSLECLKYKTSVGYVYHLNLLLQFQDINTRTKITIKGLGGRVMSSQNVRFATQCF